MNSPRDCCTIPSVLLLDEPTTGLDPGARRDLWQYLQILRDEERVSVLVTTHLMEEAERCDRLAILNEGKLVALGTPAELKHEIGGDVILLDAARDAASSRRSASAPAFTWRPLCMAKHRCASSWNKGHRFITDVVEAFPGEIQASQRQQAPLGRRFHPPHRPPLLDRTAAASGR